MVIAYVIARYAEIYCDKTVSVYSACCSLDRALSGMIRSCFCREVRNKSTGIQLIVTSTRLGLPQRAL
jgi:hypothetical protein